MGASINTSPAQVKSARWFDRLKQDSTGIDLVALSLFVLLSNNLGNYLQTCTTLMFLSSAVSTPSECLQLKNKFDPEEPYIELNVKEDEEEYKKCGRVKHIYVEK